MIEKIDKIINLERLSEVELAQMMFPRHRYPIAVLNAVKDGKRELKESEITMLNALARAEIVGQFFSVPAESNKPGLWMRCQGYEIAFMKNEALFYKAGKIIDRYAITADKCLEDFLLECLIIIKKFNGNE